MSTPVTDIVARLLAEGASHETIVFAARTVEIASRETSTLASTGLSGGSRADPDGAAERRREWDRKYRRKRRAEKKHASITASTRQSTGQVDAPIISSSSLLSCLKGTSEEESKETSVVERARRKKKPSIPLPDDWAPSESHYAAGKALGMSREKVDGIAVDLRLWAQSKDERRPGWDATFHGFLRRDAKHGGRNGFGGPRPLQDDSRSVSRAIDRRLEQSGQLSFPPRPRLLPEEREDDRRLLPAGRGTEP